MVIVLIIIIIIILTILTIINNTFWEFVQKAESDCCSLTVKTREDEEEAT